jgi:hypothetical protein
MSSRFAPRGALWLTGGVLATGLGVIVDGIFQQRVVAVLAGATFAVVFGMAIERILEAINRGVPSSPPEANDDVADSGQPGKTGDGIPERAGLVAKRHHDD